MHIGELLGAIIGKKTGIKTCDVELYKKELSKPGKFDVGAISYVEKSKYDTTYIARNIINNYIKKQKIPNQKSWLHDIETTMNAIFGYITEKHRPYQEYLDFKQDFINMIIYDLKFMNPDRNEENWMIRENKKTGEIDLYPLFDNAEVLGFGKNLKPSQIFSEEEIEKINNECILTTITPKDNQEGKQETSYKNMLEYLLKTHPIQTTKALQKASQFTIKDLEEFLSEVEEITPERKELTKQLFTKREKEINQIYEKYLEKTKREK